MNFPNECGIINPHSLSSPYQRIDCGDFCVLGYVDAHIFLLGGNYRTVLVIARNIRLTAYAVTDFTGEISLFHCGIPFLMIF